MLRGGGSEVGGTGMSASKTERASMGCFGRWLQWNRLPWLVVRASGGNPCAVNADRRLANVLARRPQCNG